jgi:hypothetical protein
MIAGCSGGGGKSGDSSGQTGTINLFLTDAAVDNVTEVWVEFTGVHLKPMSGDEIEFDFANSSTIDLLDLQNGNTEPLLADERVPAGRYEWIRLAVNAEFDNVFDSWAMLDDGSQVELRVPSGAQSGLKLVSGFTITANQSTNIVIDWDLRKALSDPTGQPGLHLRPALRVTDMAVYGSLTGTVELALVTDAICTNDLADDSGNAVYLFEGEIEDPLDIRSVDTDPVVTATVTQNPDGVYAFEVTYLSVGDYTVAFTCQASDDDPEVEDMIEFSAVNAPVTINDGLTTHVDLTAPTM